MLLVLAGALLGTTAEPSAAQQLHPQSENGIQAARIYDQVGQDSVNLFNGNVMFTVPIGETIPVGPMLKIAPTLVYNGLNLRNWTVRFPDPVIPSICPYTAASMLVADGDRIFGSGWQLHFGRIVSSPGRWDTSLCTPASQPAQATVTYTGPYPPARM
jgi:hypothetical protein